MFPADFLLRFTIGLYLLKETQRSESSEYHIRRIRTAHSIPRNALCLATGPQTTPYTSPEKSVAEDDPPHRYDFVPVFRHVYRMLTRSTGYVQNFFHAWAILLNKLISKLTFLFIVPMLVHRIIILYQLCFEHIWAK